MWRRSNLPGNPDSDQSISEEDEEHVDDEMLCPSDKGRGLLLQTKLDKLIGGCVGELNYAEEATPRKLSSSLEEVVPDSPPEECYFDSSSTRDGLTCISSAHETVPDDEMVCDEPVATWSTISKEAKSLLHLNGIAPLISSSHSSALKAKRGTKVVKDNVRPKFSFHSHTHGETSSKISDMTEYLELADDQAAIEEEEEDPIAECPNSFDEILSDNTQDAVSKLLNPPPDMIRVTKRSSKSYSRRRHDGKCFKFAHKGSSTNIHDTTDDELPGPMDSGSSTDDDEPSYHQTSVPDQKKQFVGDLFNEAVKASSLNKEGHSFDSPKLSGGSSLYGKLQQIMKQEKEMEIEITKKLQGGMGQAADASSYVDIKIVSRHLEGKLVVCKCSVIDLPGDSLLFKNTQALAGKEDTEATVIFNPKVCVDVDIEIGSFVRVHAPWKEMEVKNSKEVIILCSYFSSL